MRSRIDGDWIRLSANSDSAVVIKGSAGKDLTADDLEGLDAGYTVSKIYNTPSWWIVYTLEYPFIVNQVTRTQGVYIMENNEVVDAMDMGIREIPPTTTRNLGVFVAPLILFIFIVFLGTNEATRSPQELFPNYFLMLIVIFFSHSCLFFPINSISWIVTAVLALLAGILVGEKTMNGIKDSGARIIMGACLAGISFFNGYMTMLGFFLLVGWFTIVCTLTLLTKYYYNKKRLITKAS
jgi:hypothetical protein